jgi:hypothetical protein
MTALSHLRGVPALRPLRGQHPAVVVCLDDPAPFEQVAAELDALDGRLVVEREPGDLSARLGRPSVTVCDRFLEIELHAADVSPEEALKTVRLLESRCEECPQSGVDMAPHASHGRGYA